MKIWLLFFSVLATVALAESSGTWTQVGDDIDGEAANDRSGYSVSMSSDGTRVAIGAPSNDAGHVRVYACLLYTSPSPRDYAASRMPSSA